MTKWEGRERKPHSGKGKVPGFASSRRGGEEEGEEAAVTLINTT